VLTVGSLFSGIGGLELGLERAGMRTVWQVEKDDYARRVLARHWPDVPRWDDVRTFPPDDGRDWHCDLICGGFPCQDISSGNAGKQRGIDGERSGLWSEFARILGTLRPRFAVVENSSDLPLRGLGRVLGDLHLLGFDAEWQVVSARTFGAPHLRRRTFIVCYPNCSRQPRAVVYPKAHEERSFAESRRWWGAEPGVGRVADGVSGAMDRLRCLGNAVVPQVAEWLGRRIIANAGLV
jgi:DNA (cytosine-5)-methyltransferase 1